MQADRNIDNHRYIERETEEERERERQKRKDRLKIHKEHVADRPKTVGNTI